MKTNTAPQDYNRRVVIVSQLTKLCKDCGANVFFSPDGIYRCMACRKVNHYDEVQEKNAAEYRLMKAEEQKARALASAYAPRVDFLLENLGIALNMDAETEAEMNRWIEEEENWTLEQKMAAAFMQPDPRTLDQIADDLDDADTMQTRESDRPR